MVLTMPRWVRARYASWMTISVQRFSKSSWFSPLRHNFHWRLKSIGFQVFLSLKAKSVMNDFYRFASLLAASAFSISVHSSSTNLPGTCEKGYHWFRMKLCVTWQAWNRHFWCRVLLEVLGSIWQLLRWRPDFSWILQLSHSASWGCCGPDRWFWLCNESQKWNIKQWK